MCFVNYPDCGVDKFPGMWFTVRLIKDTQNLPVILYSSVIMLHRGIKTNSTYSYSELQINVHIH